MRDVLWRLGLTLTALGTLIFLGPGVGCNLHNSLLEWIRGQTPQAQIGRYLAAIAKGERQAALALWPAGTADDATMIARRESVTDQLLEYQPHLEYRILDLVWWRTCCEPAVIDDADQAGGAQVRVAVRGANRPETVYIFDLLVPGGYWGDAAGNPVRQWTIADVYPEGAAPLAWPWR
jgi:hypothetical protein